MAAMVAVWQLVFGRSSDAADRAQGYNRPERSNSAPAPSGLDTRAPLDAELAERLHDGNLDAFSAIFRRYYAPLVNFLRRYVDSASDAEDIAQDTMTLVWERRQHIDPTRSLRALLFTTARNRALDHHRHGRHTNRYVNRVQAVHRQGVALTVAAADADVLADELDHVAAKLIVGLPPRQREIFQLSRGRGLSPAEIAEILGIATQTVYVQLGRIAKTLYLALDPWTRK